MLWDRCVSCLSVCNAGLLWPNGWMDQGATWYGGRSRPRRHCVTWGPSSLPPRKGAQQPPLFGACLLWPNGRPSQLLLSLSRIGCRCAVPVVHPQCQRIGGNSELSPQPCSLASPFLHLPTDSWRQGRCCLYASSPTPVLEDTFGIMIQCGRCIEI